MKSSSIPSTSTASSTRHVKLYVKLHLSTQLTPKKVAKEINNELSKHPQSFGYFLSKNQLPPKNRLQSIKAGQTLNDEDIYVRITPPSSWGVGQADDYMIVFGNQPLTTENISKVKALCTPKIFVNSSGKLRFFAASAVATANVVPNLKEITTREDIMAKNTVTSQQEDNLRPESSGTKRSNHFSLCPAPLPRRVEPDKKENRKTVPIQYNRAI
jgi:hypothetical protein